MQVSPASISAFQHAQTLEKASMRVAKITLDQARSQGDAAVGLIRDAAEVGRSQQPGQTGNALGGRFDLYA